MAFSEFQTLGQALGKLQVVERSQAFLNWTPQPVPASFRADLDYILRDYNVSVSEEAVCEFLISPILREALRPFSDHMTLWSHATLVWDNQVLGIPDYCLAKRSPLSNKVLGLPLAMIKEAKRNDFSLGWGQCLAAMRVAHGLNGDGHRLVYGAATDGYTWQFGKLQNDVLTLHPDLFNLFRLEELFGALHFVLDLCKQQVLDPASAA